MQETKNYTSDCTDERIQESSNNMPCPLLLCHTRDHLRTSVNAEESEAQLQNVVSMGSGRAVNLSEESLNHNTIVSKPSVERNQTSEPLNSTELPLGGPFVDSPCLGPCPFDYCSVPGEGSKSHFS